MPGIDTTSLMNCSYGSAGFILTKIALSQKAHLVDGQGHIGTTIVFTGEGYVDDTTQAGYLTKLGNVMTAMQIDGQTFTVTGPNAQTYFILQPNSGNGTSVPFPEANQPQCLDGGPFCSFDISDGDTPCMSKIKFTVTGRLTAPVGHIYKIEQTVLPDGRVIWKETGSYSGDGGASGFAAELSSWQTSFSLPNWVVNYEYSSNLDGTLSSYMLSAEQCLSPLPSFAGAGTAVEGEETERNEIDEQQKETTVYSYDYLITGNPLLFHSQLRAGLGLAIIVRESFATTFVKGIRVKSSFTTLSSAAGKNYLTWEQSIVLAQDQPQYEEATYPGASPVAILKPQTLGHLRQSGRATALGSAVSPPAAIPVLLSKLPEITTKSIDAFQWETAWSYEGFAVNGSGSNVSINYSSLRP